MKRFMGQIMQELGSPFFPVIISLSLGLKIDGKVFSLLLSLLLLFIIPCYVFSDLLPQKVCKWNLTWVEIEQIAVPGIMC